MGSPKSWRGVWVGQEIRKDEDLVGERERERRTK
jgi:hypothetical protein